MPVPPPRLGPGSRVLLIAPAGPVTDEMIERAVARCRSLGWEPVVGASARLRTGFLAGPDEARAADLERGLEDAAVDAMWALRGGYGGIRALQHVDLGSFQARPRAFIGFSDNTIIHLALRRLGVVSFHGPHAGAEAWSAVAETAFRAVLMQGSAAGTLPAGPETPATLVDGAAEGPLVGGNLALLASTCGTALQPDVRGGILFLEDVGEPLYRIDRMLMQLRLAGVLDGVAGVALGQFTGLDDGDDGATLESVLAGALAPLGVPTVMGLPIGHVDANWTLPVGVAARLDAGAGTLTLLEPAVR